MHRLVRRCPALFAVLAVALSWGGSPAAAQDAGSVRGRVVEAGSGRPLSGAQVSIPGVGRGALTNAAGDFLLVNVPSGSRQVRAQMIGYAAAVETVDVQAGQVARTDFQLTQSAIALDEVVVTGTAGAVSKRTLGNAITKVDAEAVTQKTTITTVTELLQGKSPGVQILPNSGAPGTASDIRIRGASSFIGNKPVVYVDGIRYYIDDLGSFTPSGAGITSFSGQGTSGLNFINPEDIESIEVIKGPAAATLYGAEAASGVIQIITKKGTRGNQPVQWSAKLEMGTNEWALDVPDNFTTCDAAKIAAVDRAGQPVWPGCKGVSPGTILRDNPLRRDPLAMRDGSVLNLSVSARGGGENYSFYFAADRDDEQGIFLNSFNERNSIRANFVLSPSERVNLSLSTNYAQGELRLPIGDESAQGLLLSAFRGRPGMRTSNPLNEGWFSTRPEQANAYNNTTDSDRLTLGTTMNVNPLSWFRNRMTLGLDFTSSLAQLLSPPGSTDADYAGVPEGVVAQRIPRNYIYTLDYVGNVERALGSSIVSTTSFGAQATAKRYETLIAVGTGFGAPDVTLIGTAQNTTGSNSFVENKSVGFFVQEQIGWNNRLFLTGAVRADDNSSFGEAFDWIYYPKASLSWILSEEPAVAGLLEAARVNSFKLRAAYGHAGRAPDPFSATQTYTVDKVALGEEIASALRARSFGNRELVAERGEEFEVGFDAGLFEERLGVEFTYYNKRMEDVIIPTAVPGSTGFGSTFYGGTFSLLRNLGETSNSGIELGINLIPVQTRGLTWDSRITLATNENELVSFGDDRTEMSISGQSYGAMQRHRPGYPLGGYWGQLPKRNADGTPVVSARGVVELEPLSYIGTSAPTREVGFSNTFTLLRDIRIYALLDYKGGHKLFNYKEYNRCRFYGNCERLNDPAQADNPENAVWRQVPAAYIEDADFVKLRDISLTYSFPSDWARRFGSNAANLTVAGHNLAQWTDYTGIDPEVNTYGNRDFARADIYSLPMMRRLSLSLNVSF